MTLEQLLSPAVMDWIENNDHLSDEQFEKWLVENEDYINESVEENIEEINESIQQGYENSKLLLESVDEIDFDDIDFDDIDFDDIDTDAKKDKAISGEIEGEPLDKDKPDLSISKKIVLSNSMNNPKKNLYVAINAVYDRTVKRNTIHEKNSKLWGRFDMSGINDTTALLAFTDMRNADLSSWDMSSVETMEGMFYKSTFNNKSICEWDVSSCTDFLRMFTFSDFNQSLKFWSPGYIEKIEYDEDGTEHTVRVQANLPLIGAAADEEAEMLNRYWDEKLDEMEKEDELKENKTMKHILDYDTFINEGFGDFVKKGLDKVKSFFKNMVVKFNNFVAIFDEKGEVIDASSPYTALNYIADGEVKSVTAFTRVKNEYLNDNVKSVANIVESPEYYGIVDKNSIEYRNYLTMVDMVNEHYTKYGNKLNESATRVGFSVASGGIKGIPDITSKQLKFLLNQAIKNVPAYLSEDEEDDDYGGALLIWGAPGVGKSTIPKAIIKEWNENHSDQLKTIMVVECGNLTVDGFSLPIPLKKTVKDYMEEHPAIEKTLSKRFSETDFNLDSFLKEEIKVSGEAIKTWLPVYQVSADNNKNMAKNDIANGRIIRSRKGGKINVTETTEGGIILFDEFFRANESIFKILMQIILTRTFNDEYVLGDKWAIIACSNRPSDDKEVDRGFSSTGAVVGTRFGAGQYNFIPDFDDWKKWAVTKGHFDDATITFLMQAKDPSSGEYTNWHTIRPDEYEAGKTAWPTPRTWSLLMKELKKIMKNEGYSSIQEIPKDIILLKAGGIIGTDMAENYVKFLSTFQSEFSPKDVLNDPDYVIPNDIKCSEVIDRLKKYIDLNFDSETLPTDEQMTNMFNTLERTYNASKDNYVRPLYVSLFHKFNFLANPNEFGKVKFPNFIKAFMKKYELSSGAAIKNFIV